VVEDADKLTKIRQRAEHSTDKWNTLWAQGDRTWLLKRLDELQARIDTLERERAADNAMVDSIMASEDTRILETVTGKPGS
jgi:hypothetical protein